MHRGSLELLCLDSCAKSQKLSYLKRKYRMYELTTKFEREGLEGRKVLSIRRDQ